jgi:aldose 1-epimerase
MVFEGQVEESVFGNVDGVSIKQITISTTTITFSVITWGATITRLEVPDREGRKDNVVLGFDTMEGYRDKENR